MKNSFLGAPLFPHWLAVLATAWFVMDYTRLAVGPDGTMRTAIITK